MPDPPEHSLEIGPITGNGQAVHRIFRISSTAAVLGALLVMGGCDQADPARLIESAQAYLSKGDFRAATIDLKTALQKGPESAQARFLLGKALLAGGDATGAEVELRKALELRYPEDEVAPYLAQSMFALGQFEKLREQFGRTQLSDLQAHADLKVTLAKAYARLGRNEQARGAAEAALAAIPGYGPATLFMVGQQIDRGDADGALKVLEAEIAKRPKDHDALLLKANVLYFVKRDSDAALAIYRQAIAVKPDFVDAHGGAMTVLLDGVRVAEARTQIDQMWKALPNNPQALYFEGYLTLLERRFDVAHENAQKLVRASPEDPRVLQLAGLVEFERGNDVQAENLLGRALQLSPGLGIARRALAQTYLRRSEPAKALATIEPLLDRPEPVVASDLKMKAQAQLQQGQFTEAEATFAQAAKVEPGNPSRQTDLAVSKVLRGDTEGGLAMLRALAADKDRADADLPLIATLIRKRDYPAALQAIDTLEKKQPDRPVAPNLRAQVLLAQGDRAGAALAYEQALKLQPAFLPAASGLAELALADNKPAEARKYLDDVVKADPKNPRALLESVKLRARIGASREDIVVTLKDAIQRAPQDAALRLALIDYQLDTRQPKPALESAQQAAAALPDDLGVLDALGRAQAASGDANQAVATFNKLAQLLPNSPQPHLRLAQVHRAANNRDAEVQSLRRALAIAPDNLPAQQALANAYLAGGKVAEALDIARTIQKQRPREDVGYAFEGTIEGSRKRYDQALQAYRAGIKATGGTSELAMGVHIALMAMKQPAQADKVAAEWLKAHPTDTVFRFYLGDLAFAQRDYATAEARYRDVLKLQPEQPQALNNVAWLMATAKKPGAVPFAEKATQLRPDSTNYIDTLAMALAAEGRPAQAVEVLRKALTTDAADPVLRLSLARFLVQAGDKPAAKTELQALAGLGDKFPRQKEVAELLQTL
jgi:cellulose synthase operon protein C